MKISSATPAWVLTSGAFFFKYRNALFPTVILVVALGMRPAVFLNHPALDHWLGGFGFYLALLGEAIRFTTIAFEYIERGGKNRQVWASRLVQGGVYGLSRNPMYVGNLCIAIGMCLIAHVPLAFITIIPLFFYIYFAIVVTEEAFLRQKFGEEFTDYCRRVPRFLPHFMGFPASFEGMRYNWKRALRQDLSTLTGVMVGFVFFPVWRRFWLEGIEGLKALLPAAVYAAIGIGLFFWVIYTLKKARKLEFAWEN